MQNEESGGTFVRYRYLHFHRSGANSFRQFTMFSAICIYINCTTFKVMTANLFLKTRLQITRCTKGTVADTALYNSSPFAKQCYHIIQYLRSPEMDRYYPDYLNDKHARQNFKRKADRYKWDETRQELCYPYAGQLKNSK